MSKKPKKPVKEERFDYKAVSLDFTWQKYGSKSKQLNLNLCGVRCEMDRVYMFSEL